MKGVEDMEDQSPMRPLATTSCLKVIAKQDPHN